MSRIPKGFLGLFLFGELMHGWNGPRMPHVHCDKSDGTDLRPCLPNSPPNSMDE
jgi:hypothetical protein